MLQMHFVCFVNRNELFDCRNITRSLWVNLYCLAMAFISMILYLLWFRIYSIDCSWIDNLHFDKLILVKKNSDKLIARNSKVLWSHMPGFSRRISKYMHHIIFQSIWLVLNENIFIYLTVVDVKGMQSK